MAATTLAALGTFFTANSGAIAAVSGLAGAGAAVASSNRMAAAGRAQQRQQELQQRMARRQAIRQAQVQRARAQSTASSAGALGSSGAIGGIGSISSQLGSGLGYGSQQQGLANQVGRYQQQASNWGTVGSVAGGVFNLSGGFDNFMPQQKSASAPVPNYFPG